MSELFHHMNIPSDLGEAFVATFARMEKALKASKKYADGNQWGVSAAWDRFANDIDSALEAISDKALRDSVDFLLNEPARKEVLGGFANLTLDPKQTKAQRTLLVVRTVRNNVTHGAKISPNGEKETGRNERLVASSLLVLQHAAELRADVRAQFHDSDVPS